MVASATKSNSRSEINGVIFLTWVIELSKLLAPLRNRWVHFYSFDVYIKGFINKTLSSFVEII